MSIMTSTARRPVKWARPFSAFALLLVLGASAFAYTHRVSPLSWRIWGDTHYAQQPVALNGYDPVAYQAVGTATRGNASHSFRWADTVWHFESAQNKALFAANPKKFAPQYGGYCAFAVSTGFTAAGSPTAWHVANGNLYLFADEKVMDKWVSGLAQGSRHRSDDHWARP